MNPSINKMYSLSYLKKSVFDCISLNSGPDVGYSTSLICWSNALPLTDESSKSGLWFSGWGGVFFFIAIISSLMT